MWKLIQIGTVPAEQLRQHVLSQGFGLEVWADDIIQKVFTVKMPTWIELTKVNLSQLGFSKEVTRQEVIEEAVSRGFGVCPPEVGPLLRSQYNDQPLGEEITIGMDAIADDCEIPVIFRVAHTPRHGLWLSSAREYPINLWKPEDEWVFLPDRFRQY